MQLAWKECWELCWLAEKPEEQLEAAGTEQGVEVAAAPGLPAALARPRLPPVAVGFWDFKTLSFKIKLNYF